MKTDSLILVTVGMLLSFVLAVLFFITTIFSADKIWSFDFIGNVLFTGIFGIGWVKLLGYLMKRGY